MKVENLQIAESFKSCIFETEPFNVKKTLKDSNQLTVSVDSKFKHQIFREIKKIKITPLKNYLTIALILIFGLSQKLEAQTGKIDATFNPGGIGANGLILTTPIQPDGKIILGGDFTSYNGSVQNRLIRVDSNGILDTTFSTNFDQTVNRVIIQPDGNLIVVGDFGKCQGSNRKGIARISSTGLMESALTFNPGNGPNNIVNDVSLQPDGKILIAGGFNKFGNTTVNRITRLNSNGILDGSFNPPSAANNTIYSLALQTDGKIIAGGAFTQFNGSAYSGLVRILSGGGIDPAFTIGIGFVGTSTNTAVRACKIQSDGKILVGGLFESYNGFNMNNIIRLNTDGTRDLTFVPGTGANNIVNSITLQTDGKIIISGEFTSFNGTICNHIARLNSDGTLDNTFKPNSGANNSILSTTLQSDNKLIVGGIFTSYDGINTGSIARILMTCSTVTASILNQKNVTCNGFSNGSATVTASGGSGFTYSWSPSGGTSSIALGLSAGSYTATATNDCGNSDIASLIIFEPSPFSVVAGASSTICSGNTASLSSIGSGGTESYNFKWMPGNLITESPSTIVTVSPTITTIYTLTATDSKGCIDTKTQLVTVSGICPVSSVPCGLSYEKLNSYSTCKAVIGAINYRFRFYDNLTNELLAVKTQSSNYIYFNTVVGLNYNKTYNWTVSVDDGLGFGPESNNTCTITFNAPQTKVLCGLTFAKLNSYSTCQPITQATNYRFRFYDEGDNLMAEKIQPSNYIYFNTVSNLNYSKTYKWTVEVEYNDPGFGIMYGPASSNSCTITFNSPQTTIPCGNSYTNLNSYSTCQPVNGAINYRFSFYDAVTNALVDSKTQSSNYIYFNTVAELNYGKTYKWTVEVEYNDPVFGIMFGPASSNSCLITFNEPQTTVPCGFAYANLNSYSSCKPIKGATNYRFSFYDNVTNALIDSKIQSSNYIYFNTVAGLNYGKTYKWTVEVEYNNPIFGIMYGPASSNSCTITFNEPQTTVPCGFTYAINGYSGLTPVSGAISYRWSFYDVSTDALVATKTGTNSSPYIYFNQVSGLTFNTTYKWTVEVQYNNGVSNIFGPPSSSLCTMNYGTPSAITIDETNPNNLTARQSNQSIDINNEQLSINLFPNPTKDKITVEASEAINNIMVYNISGQLLLSLETTNEVDLSNLKSGLYIVSIETEKHTRRFKVIKE